MRLARGAGCPAGRAALTIAHRSSPAASLLSTTVGELPITISIGAVASHGLAQSPDPLIEAADAALLEAKRTGKNRTVIGSLPHDTPLAA